MEEQDLPININAGKLLDWLINRRHCVRNWQSDILTIRSKINNAIQDMPAHEEIAKLLAGTHINYFHCKQIVDILKETEADSKNLFGRYGSQRMKDWQEIIRLYEKDNLYLAEAAQMLIRNITYEVPSVKKQIQKLELIGHDLLKKKAELEKSENIVRSEFSNLCKQMGIIGKNVKTELIERVTELPEIYQKVVEKTHHLNDVVELYSAFVEFTHGRDYAGGCVPMVQYIIDKGNTTTYEWIYGEAPLSIVEPSLNVINKDDGKSLDVKNEIDFGDSPDIDFSTTEAIDLGNDNDINWGDIEVQEEPVDIDLNFSLEESGIVVEEAGHEGGNATGAEALTILDNPETQNDFIDQLLELEAFLKLRLYEIKNDSSHNFLSMSQIQGKSSILQLATLDSIKNMLDKVRIVISEILDNRVQHLHHIKHSPRYIDVLANTIEQKLGAIEKILAMQKAIKVKGEEISEQSLALQPILKLMIRRTRELQDEIEKDISKKYKNRLVRLSGGVNTL